MYDMSIHRFPLASVQQVRQHIQSALLIDTEKQAWAEIDDVPEPKSLDDLSGLFTLGSLSAEEIAAPRQQSLWSVSRVNPGAALLKLPGIQLKPTWRLVSYLYEDGDSGAGIVYALPEELATTARLERGITASGTLKQPPKPEGALVDFMEAIDGNRSAVSYLVASLLCRELREFGATGHYRNWAHHRLIEAVPAKVKWQWQAEQPKDFNPKAKISPDGQAIVEFFTCRVSSGVGLYRHVDQYLPNQYKPKRIDKAIATVQR